MAEQLSDRGKRILEAVIEDYIATAEPVGSRTITRSHALALSPATVRNVMSDLEEMGFLTSPHTSAGRIPTDKAYRLYVNSILEVKNLAKDNKEEIQRRCRLAEVARLTASGALLREQDRVRLAPEAVILANSIFSRFL